MRTSSLAAALIALSALAACPRTSPPPPGYSGPLPSVAAQQALHAIEGQVLRGSPIGNGGPGLTVESFAVIPNSVTGKGPVVVLVTPGGATAPLDTSMPNGAYGRWILPVQTDGDAADLVRRVTGQAPTGFGGELSAEYRAVMQVK